ncbi:hypothetical protein [Rhodopseudomonas sp. P2A-2r]|uniref:hypothetical protein n=1 Tax=unclassified Rhodopseudomonas TaxID=2638247 RepID=UPI0022342674|nr:hypothetical protein [Rhodopseudomonas sp. P2A-2r]UZE51597.1 hypothetical protein ONR75_13975 [Rhodopseudomonas sp. P2A-2r]
MAAYLDGESRDRLSERYGVPVNTIKTWIRRALIEIRSNLQGPGGATEWASLRRGPATSYADRA